MFGFLRAIYAFFSAVGAINWGLVAFLNINLVEYITPYLQMIPYVDKIIYGVIAFSGAMLLITLLIGD
jgi:uncharacterized membrane protein YuzA (DUF378 family)